MLEIQDGQYYNVKLTRLHYPEPAVVFEGRARLRREWSVVIPAVVAWAEYDLRYDVEESSDCCMILIAEDYQMEVEALP